MKKKHLDQKSWYTLQEAADRLTESLDVTVSKNDVLGLWRDAKIQISWDLNDTLSQPTTQGEEELIENHDQFVRLDGPHIIKYCVSFYHDAISGKLDDNCACYYRTIVTNPDNQKSYWMLVYASYNIELDKETEFPCLREEVSPMLTIASVGLRLEDIKAFEESNKNQKVDLTERERTSLLRIIFVMAKCRYDYDPGKIRNAATGDKKGSIAFDMEQSDHPMDADTIRSYLQEAANLFG